MKLFLLPWQAFKTFNLDVNMLVYTIRQETIFIQMFSEYGQVWTGCSLYAIATFSVGDRSNITSTPTIINLLTNRRRIMTLGLEAASISVYYVLIACQLRIK